MVGVLMTSTSRTGPDDLVRAIEAIPGMGLVANYRIWGEEGERGLTIGIIGGEIGVAHGATGVERALYDFFGPRFNFINVSWARDVPSIPVEDRPDFGTGGVGVEEAVGARPGTAWAMGLFSSPVLILILLALVLWAVLG